MGKVRLVRFPACPDFALLHRDISLFAGQYGVLLIPGTQLGLLKAVLNQIQNPRLYLALFNILMKNLCFCILGRLKYKVIPDNDRADFYFLNLSAAFSITQCHIGQFPCQGLI